MEVVAGRAGPVHDSGAAIAQGPGHRAVEIARPQPVTADPEQELPELARAAERPAEQAGEKQDRQPKDDCGLQHADHR